jgi:hypothetical protein
MSAATSRGERPVVSISTHSTRTEARDGRASSAPSRAVATSRPRSSRRARAAARWLPVVACPSRSQADAPPGAHEARGELGERGGLADAGGADEGDHTGLRGHTGARFARFWGCPRSRTCRPSAAAAASSANGPRARLRSRREHIFDQRRRTRRCAAARARRPPRPASRVSAGATAPFFWCSGRRAIGIGDGDGHAPVGHGLVREHERVVPVLHAARSSASRRSRPRTRWICMVHPPADDPTVCTLLAGTTSW